MKKEVVDMRCVCFFHRNEFHNQIYPKMGRYINTNYNVGVKHVRRINNVIGEDVFEYEREIGKIWDEIDITNAALRRLEEKYHNAELMRLVFADRNCNFFPKYLGRDKIPYEKQLKYLVGCFEVFERYLDNNIIDCVVSDLSIGIADIFRYVCERRGVEYLTIRSSKIGSGFIFSDPDYDTPFGLNELYVQYLNNGVPDVYLVLAREHISQIRQKVVAPLYMEVTKQSYHVLSAAKLKSFLVNSWRKYSRVTPISFDKKPILTSIQWNINKIKNIWMMRRNKESWFESVIPEGIKYYVFTLQYEPENSTTIRSFPFSNQLCVIENIAKALPIGVYLVVKEHRGNQGYRKSDDYKNIWYLPNVKLAPPEYSINKLVKNSLGVITLTSRMGWEGVVLGKTVIGLGTTFYSKLEAVKKPGTWCELKKILNDGAYAGSSSIGSYDDVDLEAFAAAYFALTHEGKYVFKGAGVTSDTNIKLLSDALLNEFKSRRKQ